MENSKIDKTREMVKGTLKRADDSTGDDRWVYKTIDDNPESELTGHGANQVLSVDEENFNNESEDSGNWYLTIPSCLEVEIKEVDDAQSTRESSKENKNTFQNQNPTYIRETAGSAGNSCIDPMDLSASNSNCKSQRDEANVFVKRPIEAHAPRSKFLGNPCANSPNTPSLTWPNGIKQGKATSDFPRAMWSQSTSLSPVQRQLNTGEIVTMESRAMLSTDQNFPTTIHRNCQGSINKGLVNSETSEIIAKGHSPYLQREPLMVNYFTEERNYGHSSNVSDTGANRSNNWPLGSVSNANNFATRNGIAERIGENFVCNLPQNSTHNLKRPSKSCAQVGSKDALEPVRPPKRKRSDAGATGKTYYCKICDTTYKSSQGYSKHFHQEKHLSMIKLTVPPPSNLYSFQPCSASTPFGPSILYTQPQPPLPYVMNNPILHYQMLQAHAMATANQSVGDIGKMNNTYVQKLHPETSKYDFNEEPLGRNGSHKLDTKYHAQNSRQMNLPVNITSNPQGIHLLPKNSHSHPEASKYDFNEETMGHNGSQNNNLDTKLHAQNPSPMNLLVDHTNNRQGIQLLPRNSQSESLIMAIPKCFENKESQSSRLHKNLSSQIQPENSRVERSNGMSDPCGFKLNSPENFTVAGSFQKKSENVQSVSSQQSDFFKVYHCGVCSTFCTDSMQELEQHVSIDRSKTPFQMITVSGDDLCCKLCNFQTQTSKQMGRHCANKVHLNRVDYYNHVMESGIDAKQKLNNLHMFTPVFLSCSACKFSTTTMDTLKLHSAHPCHHRNVLCCMYVLKMSPIVEFCDCRVCYMRFPTKEKLLLHLLSEMHIKMLWHYPTNISAFTDPSNLFFIQEKSLNRNEPPRVSEQIEGSSCIGREKPHLRKETKRTDITENPTPLDLSSASSTSLKPLPVSCSLCQQKLPDINVLAQHLQQIHGVNEAGVKWLISATTKVHKEKSLSTEEISNTEASEPKSIVFSPQKPSAIGKTLFIQDMGIDSSSYQSSVSNGNNEERKSYECPKAVTSELNAAIGENLDGGGIAGTDSSILQLDKTKPMQNMDKPDKELRICKDLSSSQQLCETGRMQNQDKLDKNLEGIIAVDFSSSQHLCEAEQIQNPRQSNTEYSTSQHIDEKGIHNSVKSNQNPDFDQERVNVNPSSQQSHKTEIIPALEEEKYSNSAENQNSSSSQAEVIVEYVSELNEDRKYETETDDSLSEDFLATEHKSPVIPSDCNASRERNDSSSSSDYDSVTPDRLLAIYDSTKANQSLTPQSDLNVSRERNNSSSSDNTSVSHERSPLTGNSFCDKHNSPIANSGLSARGERNDSSSSDHNSVTRQQSSSSTEDYVIDLLSSELGSPKSQMHFKGKRKRNDLSNDNILVEYESLPARAKTNRANSLPSQNHLLNSNHRRSPSENQQTVSVNGSPISRLMALSESKKVADNISVMRENSDHTHSANGQMLYECPNEYEAELSAPNSPSAGDLQMEARNKIENIKISGVFSLTDGVENRSNTDDDEESLDFENIEFSDLEDL